MIQLNYRDSRPIYEQIKDSFRKLIISGAMEPNEKLPSVRTLAVELSINPNTIQRAVTELEGEGYIYTIPGKGSFVSPDCHRDEARVTELFTAMREIVDELRFWGVSEAELLNALREEEK